MINASYMNKAASWQSFLVPGILMLIAYVAFSNTFVNGWTYDDFPVIVENPDVWSWAGFMKNSYPGRPLRELTYLFDHSLFGMNPFGWHIQQIFWHGLNACLVYCLGRKLQLASWAAFGAALIFMLHPLQVEVVANLSHRKDSLALAGSLSSILLYICVIQGRQRKLFLLIAAILAFVLALAAKQTAIMVPIVCVFYELFLSPKPQRLLTRSTLSVVVIPLLSVAIGAYVFWVAGGFQQLQFAMQDTLSFKANYFERATVPVYYLTVLKAWVFMGSKFLWPANLALEYTFPVATSLFDPWVIAGFVVLGLSIYTVVACSRRYPAVSWLILSGFCFFLPTANLWPLTYLAADRYLYAPLAFFALLLGYILSRVDSLKKPLTGVMMIVSLALGVLTWQQNQVWRSPKTLWSHALRVSPESSFALNNLGNIALQDQQVDQARQLYQRAAQVNPLNPTAHYNLGYLAEMRGNLQEALMHYRAFAKLDHPVFKRQLQVLRQHLLSRYRVSL